MPIDNSITIWIRRLASGDRAAVEPIWKRFFRRMTGLARKQLDSVPGPRGEEEDVALSAFHQFCRAAIDNRFPNIEGRQDLWHLLAALTARKAVDHYRAVAAQKRGPGEAMPLHENIAVARDPDPVLQAVLADEIRALFSCLGDESLQTVAEMKLNGLPNDEIALQLGCTVRTVHRRIGMIRDIWQSAGTADNSQP